eukprot:3378604-Karenia_brevis.AAC.1
MGVCPSRCERLEEVTEEEVDEVQVRRRAKFVKAQRRIAYRRKLWAALGHHLNEIRRQGRT